MMSLVKKVKIAEDVKRFALRLTLATHPDSAEAVETVRKYVRYGASPRAGQAMVLAGKAGPWPRVATTFRSTTSAPVPWLP